MPLLENASLNSSVMTLWVISCERYQAICRSLKPNQCQLSQRPMRCILFIWMFAIIASLPFSFMSEIEIVPYYDGSIVSVCRTKVELPWHFIYVWIVIAIFFIVPLIVLVFMYSAIIRKIFLTQTPDENPPSRQRKQAIIMIICVVSLFFLSLLPIRTVTVWILYSSNEDKISLGFEGYNNVLNIAKIMMYINSAGNPIIYGLVSSRFRLAFRKTLGNCFRLSDTYFGNSTIVRGSTANGSQLKVYRFDKRENSTIPVCESCIDNTVV